MEYIYILSLADGKWYVGRTNDVNNRLKQHQSGHGSQWTKKYEVVKIVETIPSQDRLDEDYHVKKYMKKYGIENVRGGSYSQINLPDYQIKALRTEFRGASDNCFKCGQPGHFAKACPSILCTKCGRSSHTVEKCHAKTDVDGNPLEEPKYVGTSTRTPNTKPNSASTSSQEECCIL